ncbi:BCCT family transporter [Actinomyces bowdenii]|uniref:BCCT family transporter n=1 Tax=Actinomyces bowdenii TaxID=131109 RepID=UPI001ABD2AC1|nr:BCCT family transporter [Actinomyces bowdenii]MBO3724311.1 BCCT family transporter [Actinomyces bowdenii]
MSAEPPKTTTPAKTPDTTASHNPPAPAAAPESTAAAFETSPVSVHRRQRHMIDRLRTSLTRQTPQTREGMDPVVFGVASILTIGFVVWGFLDAGSLGRLSSAALDGTIRNFGWLFVVSASFFVIFVVFIASSRFGRIPLGGDAEEPEFRTSSWISMMFATGMGIGLIFYGVGEPLWFYMSPPPGTVDAQTAEAASTAMGTALFHWTIYPWAMYALVGLGMAYSTYRLGRSQLFSAMFTSLFGRAAIDGVGGRIINILAIVATLFGSACSLGLGALQIGGGMAAANLVDRIGSGLLVGIIAVLTACFVASAISGIERGIQWLSNINMVLAVLLAVIVFVGGPTLFILNIIPSAVGEFISELPEMASRTSAVGDEDMASWLASWTVFYWAWWISWTPFVGMFIARISRGRTVRQFVTGVMFVPSVVSLAWFAIFGGGAIGLQERAERANDTVGMLVHQTSEGPDLDFNTILFQLLDAVPVPKVVLFILMALAVVLVAIFFVTGADSASIVMGGLSENGAAEPSRFTVVFWGVATGAVSAAMLLAGGDDPAEVLTGVRNITIVSALPFVVVMLLLCVSIYKDLSNDPLLLRHQLASQVLVDSVTTATEVHEGAESIGLHTSPIASPSEAGDDDADPDDTADWEGAGASPGPGARDGA